VYMYMHTDVGAHVWKQPSVVQACRPMQLRHVWQELTTGAVTYTQHHWLSK
jgi:hypothetical protein